MSIRTTLFAASLVALVAGPALAAEDLFPPGSGGTSDGPFTLSGSLAGTSEYFFRGLSQSDDKPAVQGGLNAAYKFSDSLSANAGIWASNVDFAPDARIEVDYLAGLSGSVMGVSWTAGGIYYSYPGSNNGGGLNESFDWWELTGGLGYDFGLFSLGATVAYAPTFQAGASQIRDSGEGWYVNGNIKIPVKYIDIVGSVGRQYIEHPIRYLGVTDDTYLDYKVGIQALVYGFNLELAWVDTDLDDRVVTNAAKNQIVFTVTKNF